MMFEINLIRERAVLYRKRIIKLSFVYSAVLVSLLSIIAGASGYLSNFYKIRTYKVQISRLNTRMSNLGFSPDSIRNYKGELESLSRELSLIEKSRPERILWAPKLAAVSALLPSDMWVHKISVRGETEKGASKSPKPRILVLEGYVLPKKGRELIHLKDFIVALKKNPLFMEDLSGVELVFVRQEKKGDSEVTAFQLSCPFSK